MHCRYPHIAAPNTPLASLSLSPLSRQPTVVCAQNAPELPRTRSTKAKRNDKKKSLSPDAITLVPKRMSSSFLESIQSLFGGANNNRFNEQKLKTNLKILSGRIKLLTDKRRARIASNENAIAKVLETCSSFKATSLLSDDDNDEDRRGSSSEEKSKAMETLLARCESIGKETKFLEILKRVQSFASAILETCERHPAELELTGKNRTAVASMFYAKSADGGRLVNDLPELKSIANELAKKFGKEFALSCEREKTSEACGVSKAFMVIAKERRNADTCGKEARVLLEKMAKEKGVALPSTSAKKKPSSSSSKKKKKSTRRSKSSSEASSSSGGESSDIDDTSSSRRKSNKTSNYASAETAAKAARDAANKAQEAAEYAEALVATNELFATTLKHDDVDDDDIGTEKEDEINSIIAAAADEAKLEEERNENENEGISAPLRRKTNGGGPPPGVASAQKKTVVDDALADRFEKLKTTKK